MSTDLGIGGIGIGQLSILGLGVIGIAILSKECPRKVYSVLKGLGSHCS